MKECVAAGTFRVTRRRPLTKLRRRMLDRSAMSDSSDDELFLSASEGEDNGDDTEQRTEFKAEESALNVEEKEAVGEEASRTDQGAEADAEELRAEVEENLEVACPETAVETEERGEEVSAVEAEEHQEDASVETEEEEPRECPPDSSQRKSSSSTEEISKQEIAELTTSMGNQRLSESAPEEETTSSKELGWDDFKLEIEDEDESNADGWDTWDGPENEPEASIDKMGAEEESSWFKEQLSSDKPKEEITRSKGSMWEWSGINDVVSAVGEGFSSVVENSLGLPSAEEMARRTKEQEKEEGPSNEETPIETQQSQSQAGPAGFGGLFSGFVTGGLDVLETLGKKTFETLTVKDEGAEQNSRRFVFQPEGPTSLSQALKERMRAEDQGQPSEQSLAGYGSTSSEKFHGICFQKEFDQDEGSVHLEGLQLISSNFARQNVRPSSKSGFEFLVKGFHVDDSDVSETSSFEAELKAALSEVNLPYKAPNMIASHKAFISAMETAEAEADEVYRTAIATLAKFTAQSIQVFHKLSQLMLIAGSFPPPESLVALAILFCRRINFISQHYAQSISCDFSDTADEMVTTIYFEASNAHYHIRTALECFKPFY
uniref:VPS9 domain-containing protein n=1 Tax=Steinernema glaseri TaxID=37863 RepID=A0A1I7YMW2_9BILA